MNNRAAKYGDGLFETIRVSQGKILFAKDHFARLSKGFSVLKFEPISYTTFLEIINKYINTKSNMNLRIRITFFRLGAGLYTPQEQKWDFFVESSPLSSAEYEWVEEGLKIGIAKDVYLNTDILSNLKTISALPYVLAGLQKKANNWEDCLLLNHRGNIAESIAANVFLYQKGTLFTPALMEGCIEGIMRKQMIEIAQQNQIQVLGKAITKEDLQAAEAIFLTNAISGVKWVKEIVGIKKSYHSEIAAFFMNQLNQIIKPQQHL